MLSRSCRCQFLPLNPHRSRHLDRSAAEWRDPRISFLLLPLPVLLNPPKHSRAPSKGHLIGERWGTHASQLTYIETHPKPPPRRIGCIAVFDNSAEHHTNKPKFMNTLQPPTPFYKTFWTCKR